MGQTAIIFSVCENIKLALNGVYCSAMAIFSLSLFQYDFDLIGMLSEAGYFLNRFH